MGEYGGEDVLLPLKRSNGLSKSLLPLRMWRGRLVKVLLPLSVRIGDCTS